MRRFWLVLLLIGVLFSPMFGAAAEQKIYPVDSEPFQIITSLYITQGLALPSTAGPHSGDELMKMLDRIDVDHSILNKKPLSEVRRTARGAERRHHQVETALGVHPQGYHQLHP